MSRPFRGPWKNALCSLLQPPQIGSIMWFHYVIRKRLSAQFLVLTLRISTSRVWEYSQRIAAEVLTAGLWGIPSSIFRGYSQRVAGVNRIWFLVYPQRFEYSQRGMFAGHVFRDTPRGVPGGRIATITNFPKGWEWIPFGPAASFCWNRQWSSAQWKQWKYHPSSLSSLSSLLVDLSLADENLLFISFFLFSLASKWWLVSILFLGFDLEGRDVPTALFRRTWTCRSFAPSNQFSYICRIFLFWPQVIWRFPNLFVYSASLFRHPANPFEYSQRPICQPAVSFWGLPTTTVWSICTSPGGSCIICEGVHKGLREVLSALRNIHSNSSEITSMAAYGARCGYLKGKDTRSGLPGSDTSEFWCIWNGFSVHLQRASEYYYSCNGSVGVGFPAALNG